MNFHRKLAAAITGVLFLSPLLGSCAHSTDPHAVKINDAGEVSHLIETPVQNATGWKATATWFAIHNSASPVVSTPGGPIVLFDPSRTQKTSSSPGETATGTLVALNSKDGSVRWARTVEPGFPEEYFREPNDIEDDMPQTIFEQALRGRRKFVAASPNGRYLAVRLLPYMTSKNPHSFNDQHTHIIVLDTETGNEVRTVEVTGIVLGHALTNNALAVETAENFYPADTGKLDIFSLANSQEKPTTMRTNRWLVGATNNSLLLSEQDLQGSYGDSIYALSALNITGEEEDTITGVAAIHPGGWIERFKDPETAATIFQTTQGETQRTKELDALPRDLINLETGTTFDITGLSTTEVILPTSPGILLRTATTTEKDRKESTTYTATSWLSATPEARELRADDMQHIKGEVASEPIHMGDEVR